MINQRIQGKIERCVRLARECSRYSWQEPLRDRKEFLRVKRESMQDARHWKALYK